MAAVCIRQPLIFKAADTFFHCIHKKRGFLESFLSYHIEPFIMALVGLRLGSA